MSNEHRYVYSQLQKIRLAKIYNKERILDIGGGGEGIIGKLYGRNVVAIDKRVDELYETSNESLKIEMDAAEMKFLDSTFDVITSFYTLLYMKNEAIKNAIKECYRVLKKEGVMEIWDIEIPQFTGGDKDIFVANLEIEMPEETIRTGYGVLMSADERRADCIRSICESVGFRIEQQSQESESYYFRLKK